MGTDTMAAIELAPVAVAEPTTPSASAPASTTHSHANLIINNNHDDDDNAPPADSSSNSNTLPPIDGGTGAWLYLLGATLTEALSFGVAYSQGTFLAFHTTNPSSPFHASSASALTAVGSIMTGATFAMPYLAHGFFEANPRLVRAIYAACVGITAVALVAASLLPPNSAGPLVLLQGVIPGICGGLAFLPAQLWLSQWFDKRRSAAAAIMYLGSGIGGVVFPLVLDGLLASTGFRWTLRVQAGIQLAGGALALSVMRPRLPTPPASASIPVFHKSQWRRYLPGSWRPLLSLGGSVGAVLTIAQAAAYSAVSLYLSTLCISIGLRESTANALLAAYNGSAVLSFLLVALAIDKLSVSTLMAISTAGCALAASTLLGFANSLGLVLAFVLLFSVLGAGFSVFVVTLARIVVERNARLGKGTHHTQQTHQGRSPDDFTLVSCIYIFVRGMGATAGPLIASTLYDARRAGVVDLWGGHGMKRLIVFSASVMGGVAVLAVGFRKQLR